MLVSLITQHLIVHPYIDRDYLSFLALDGRSSAIATPYDGFVYAQEGSRPTQTLIETHQVADGFIRTAIPLHVAQGRRYYCGHVWRLQQNEDAKKNGRILKAHLDQSLLRLVLDNAPQVTVDLGVEMEFQSEDRTLWDHLTD